MKTYTEIREESSRKLDALIKEVGMFFAFSQKQFNEGKTPLSEGDKYVSIGAGGYMPKSNVQKFLKGQYEIATWEQLEIKKARRLKEDHIIYELNNHECFYTNDIDDAVRVLPYPRKDIIKVYNKQLLIFKKS